MLSGAGSRGLVTTFVTMPEATMDENDCIVPREHKVWFSGKVPMQTEAQACLMQKTANSKLWSRVLAANAGHHPASGCLVDDIGHALMIEQAVASLCE